MLEIQGKEEEGFQGSTQLFSVEGLGYGLRFTVYSSGFRILNVGVGVWAFGSAFRGRVSA